MVFFGIWLVASLSILTFYSFLRLIWSGITHFMRCWKLLSSIFVYVEYVIFNIERTSMFSTRWLYPYMLYTKRNTRHFKCLVNIFLLTWTVKSIVAIKLFSSHIWSMIYGSCFLWFELDVVVKCLLVHVRKTRFFINYSKVAVPFIRVSSILWTYMKCYYVHCTNSLRCFGSLTWFRISSLQWTLNLAFSLQGAFLVFLFFDKFGFSHYGKCFLTDLGLTLYAYLPTDIYYTTANFIILLTLIITFFPDVCCQLFLFN